MSDVDNREGYPCVGQGVYEKSLYLLNFIVNLKLFSKIVFFFKQVIGKYTDKVQREKGGKYRKKHTTHIRNVFRIVEEEERRKTYVEKNNI